jgi:hypothetical protein
MKGHALLWAAAGAVVLTGCSSKPRNFAPVMAAPPADAQAYEAQWLACREQVAMTAKNGSGRLASAAGGAAAGVGGAVAVGTSAGASAGMVGAMAAATATVILAPIAAIGGAWGISKIKKTKKEKAIKAATAECMAKSGYAVDKWRVMSKREVRALPAAVFPTAQPVAAAPPAPATGIAEPK